MLTFHGFINYFEILISIKATEQHLTQVSGRGEIAVTNNLEKISYLTYKENDQLTIREPRSYLPSSYSLRWGSQPCLGAPFPPRGLD